uniref:Uncharacterized protein n=1 Tax=Daphnia galeata TaxID=27404 RepID=A0A8J2W457_9CRUS|nr:unnamed protein product [Daphnia galeata]
MFLMVFSHEDQVRKSRTRDNYSFEATVAQALKLCVFDGVMRDGVRCNRATPLGFHQNSFSIWQTKLTAAPPDYESDE